MVFGKNKLTMMLFIIYNLIVLSLLSLFFNQVSIFFIGMIGLGILLICSGNLDTAMFKALFWIYTVAVLWMVLIYFGEISKYGKPYYGNDDELFEQYGRALYDGGVFNFSKVPYIPGMHYAKGYLVIIAWIMRISSIFGEYHTISPRLINIYIWIAIAVLFYKYVKTTDKTNIRLLKKITIGLAIFPNALYISANVYRDTIVAFILFGCVYSVQQVMANRDVAQIWRLINCCLVCSAAFYFMYYIRAQLMIVLLALIGIQLFWDKGRKNKWMKRLMLGAVGLIVMIFYGGFELLEKVTSYYTGYRVNRIDGFSNIVFSTSILPFGIFLRTIWGLITPFPGAILKLNVISEPLYSFYQILIYFGTIIQIFALPYVIKKALKFDSNALQFALVFLSIIITTFTFRHFIMIYPFMAIELYGGLKETTRFQREKYTVYVFAMGMILCFLYMILK